MRGETRGQLWRKDSRGSTGEKLNLQRHHPAPALCCNPAKENKAVAIPNHPTVCSAQCKPGVKTQTKINTTFFWGKKIRFPSGMSQFENLICFLMKALPRHQHTGISTWCELHWQFIIGIMSLVVPCSAILRMGNTDLCSGNAFF